MKTCFIDEPIMAGFRQVFHMDETWIGRWETSRPCQVRRLGRPQPYVPATTGTPILKPRCCRDIARFLCRIGTEHTAHVEGKEKLSQTMPGIGTAASP